MAKNPDPRDFDDDDDEFGDEFSAELDNELLADLADTWNEDDEAVDPYEGEDAEPEGEVATLRERFLGDGYRVVNLADLAALEEQADLDPLLPDLSLEDVLYALARDEDDLPAKQMMAFSGLSRTDQDLVRSVWMQIPVEHRNAAASAVVALVEEWSELDFGAFFRVLLDDADPTVRRLAVEGLSDEEAPELLGSFIHLLETDADTGVRAAAAQALGPFVLQGELDELDAARAMRAEQALMTVLANRTEPLDLRCRALESICYSGEVGVRQLIEDAYYASDEELRLSALLAMGRSADVRWRRLARAELTNPSAAMRAQAAFACGELEARAALPDLLKLLMDRDETVRIAAMFALGHIGGRRARAALQLIADSRNEVDAFAASEALEEMDFYDSQLAHTVPLFDAPASEDDEWAERSGWEAGDGHDADDDDLGEYV